MVTEAISFGWIGEFQHLDRHISHILICLTNNIPPNGGVRKIIDSKVPAGRGCICYCISLEGRLCIYLRMAASSQHFRNWWQTRQSYGPLGLTSKWLARQGWQHTNLPWTWSHPLIQVVLTADPSTTMQQAAFAASSSSIDTLRAT